MNEASPMTLRQLKVRDEPARLSRSQVFARYMHLCPVTHKIVPLLLNLKGKSKSCLTVEGLRRNILLII